jgi:hypothetical protein
MHSPLHVSVHPDHPQGAYADPCYSYTFVELSVKYIVKRFAVLWKHVFQALVCIEYRAECAHSARYSIHTQQPETHVATTLQNV